VAGTPGTLPTNWTQITIGGLTRTIVGTGTENGLSYVDIRYNGTATGPSTFLGFETVTGITASTGQTWNGSFYLKTIATPSPPNFFRSTIAEYTSLGVYIRDVAIAITPTSNLNRFSQTETLAGGATTARVVNGIAGILTIGATYDFTFRIAAPQMELGAYATTWVPTTTAAVTRLADAASKTGVSSLIGQTEGTLFANVQFNILDNTDSWLTISSGNNVNWIFFGKNSNKIRAYVKGNNLIVFDNSVTNITSNQSMKIALAYKSGDIALYINGGLIATTTSSFTFSSSLSLIAVDSSNGTSENVTLTSIYEEVALFKTRLTNAQLAQLTTL
jgi:hypothetical protein